MHQRFLQPLLQLPGLLIFSLLAAAAQAQFPDDQRVQSPVVHDDHSVTFRLRAPEANAVNLASSGDIPVIPFGQSLPMEQDDDGVWSLTIGPVDPGAYRYNFNVDGVAVLDPMNPLTSASNDNPWSLFNIEGAAFMDTQNVPHGALAEAYYYSGHLDRTRRMHVWTPPGLDTDQDYPVFYLLHGAMDSDDSWGTVGRAGFILDNLLAENSIDPMIVVMPHGHTSSFNMGSDALETEDFVTEFVEDIKPWVEANYPVSAKREDTAIAGLSMGGMQTLDIAFGNLAEYGYIGVYSSGIFSVAEDDSWEQAHQTTLSDVSLRDGLALVWFATGKDDFLLETTHASVALLEKYDFDVIYEETEGGHTWINWRNYLHSFAPQLFK